MDGYAIKVLRYPLIGLLASACFALPAFAANMATSFDGVDDHLNRTGSAALKPAVQVAVEAWIKVAGTDIYGGEVIALGDRYLLRVKPDGLLFFYTAGSSQNKGLSASGGYLKDNVWHHVVGQKTATGLGLYVDGVARGNTTAAFNISYYSNSNLFIGRHAMGATGYDFKGLIDEVRIYNRALTAAEIAAHYNAGLGQYGSAESGLVGGWHLDEGTGTTTADYSGNNFTLTLKNGTTWAAGKVSGSGVDSANPTVSLTAPANSAQVSGTAVTVSANASDDVAVAGVQFKLDGTPLAAEDTTSPYSIVWNTTQTANGSHTLTAEARDTANKRTTSTAVTVSVNNSVVDTTPPSGTITINAGAPATKAAAVTLTLTASDPGGGAVGAMRFANDGGTYSPDEPFATSRPNWTLGTGEGTKTVCVQFKDAAGNWSLPASAPSPHCDTIAVDTTPPTFDFISPKEKDILPAPGQ